MLRVIGPFRAKILLIIIYLLVFLFHLSLIIKLMKLDCYIIILLYVHDNHY